MASIVWPPETATKPLAVLVSGGLDSAILLGEAVRVYPSVQPIFIRTGSRWEDVENEYLRRFLGIVSSHLAPRDGIQNHLAERDDYTPILQPLVELHQPMSDVYGEHWSTTGRDIPGHDTPDEAVYLPGRNVILLAKAIIWCHLNGISEIATAPLGSNPFPDATPEFYDGFAAMVSLGLAGTVRVLRPYANLGYHKRDVLLRGRGMPLEHTFSCISPIDGLHCGVCNKCAERQNGFHDAGMIDPTRYAKE